MTSPDRERAERCYDNATTAFRRRGGYDGRSIYVAAIEAELAAVRLEATREAIELAIQTTSAAIYACAPDQISADIVRNVEYDLRALLPPPVPKEPTTC